MNKLITTGLALASAGAIALGVSKSRNKKRLTSIPRGKRNSEVRRHAEKSAQRYLMYFIMPAWSLAGALAPPDEN